MYMLEADRGEGLQDRAPLPHGRLGIGAGVAGTGR